MTPSVTIEGIDIESEKKSKYLGLLMLFFMTSIEVVLNYII